MTGQTGQTIQTGQPFLWQTGHHIQTGQLYSYWWNRRTDYTDGTAGIVADGTAYTDGTAIQLLVEQTGQTDSLYRRDSRSCGRRDIIYRRDSYTVIGGTDRTAWNVLMLFCCNADFFLYGCQLLNIAFHYSLTIIDCVLLLLMPLDCH